MSTFADITAEHLGVIQQLESQHDLIESAGQLLLKTFEQGNKILLCGNGGSAADCQHIAAEFMVRYVEQRHPLPAIALTTDTSILTAHPNDFEFDTVFSRQVEALGNKGDCLIAISTSGNSKNIIAAAEVALSKGIELIVLSGNTGGQLAQQAPLCITVNSKVTARIQEAHILIGHWWCQIADMYYTKK